MSDDPAHGKIIDAWAQPPVPDMIKRVPEVKRLLQLSGMAHLADVEVTPEMVVDMMDAAGVGRVLLSAWCRSGQWIITNDDVAKYCRKFPDRFIGVATVDLEKPIAAVHEIDRAVNDLGMKALRVIPWLWKLPPNDKLYYPLYVKCIELDIPFCTQVGHTGPLMPSEPGRPVPYLEEVALTFPELRIVGGHIGYPWTDEMIGQAWKHENVFIDTSAYLPRYYPPELIKFMSTYGRDKVLFGTNFPMLDFGRCAEQALALELPEEARSAFLWENAARVFKL